MTATERRTVIPWVVLWSAQRDALGDTWDVRWSPQGLVVPGGHVAWGFHWKLYDGLLRGQGRPIFSELDTARQIAAMRGPRCQVCGVKLPKTNTPWLLTSLDQANLADGHAVTPTAPTCEACWPVAERLCPHLVEQPPRRVHVPSFKVWGGSGKSYALPKDWPDGHRGHFQIGCPEAPWVFASQLLVELEGVQL